MARLGEPPVADVAVERVEQGTRRGGSLTLAYPVLGLRFVIEREHRADADPPRFGGARKLIGPALMVVLVVVVLFALGVVAGTRRSVAGKVSQGILAIALLAYVASKFFGK